MSDCGRSLSRNFLMPFPLPQKPKRPKIEPKEVFLQKQITFRFSRRIRYHLQGVQHNHPPLFSRVFPQPFVRERKYTQQTRARSTFMPTIVYYYYFHFASGWDCERRAVNENREGASFQRQTRIRL